MHGKHRIVKTARFVDFIQKFILPQKEKKQKTVQNI